jgi:hypothetical protein
VTIKFHPVGLGPTHQPYWRSEHAIDIAPKDRRVARLTVREL